MPHHQHTPQRVLDAPPPTVTVDATPRGATRRERRHGVVPPVGLDAKGLARYLRAIAVPNTPAVRTSARRGRKVSRGRS